MPRVSVVAVSAEQVVFAPHTEVRWLTRDLVNDCGTTLPEVGQVGEFEEDCSNWIFEVDPGWRVELRGLKAVGSPELMTFRVNGTRTVIDLTDHGVPPAMKAKAARLRFWLLVRRDGDVAAVPDQGGLYGHFDHPDVPSWVAEIEQEAAAETQRKQDAELLWRKRESEKTSRDHFINPYTFVPFPAQPPQRVKPYGHHALAEERKEARFAGRITAQLVARSPLLVRNVGSAAPLVDDVMTAPRTGTGLLFIPGSSLHGAIRSLHETLTGSCLRVFDPDFVPVYRDVASGALRQGWDLGVVEEVGQDHAGRPTRLTRCDETRWVPLTTLARSIPKGGAVTTGQRFQLNEQDFSTQHGREVYKETASAILDPNGGWVVLVTDDSARKSNMPYYCAVGRLPATPQPMALTDRAWHEYLRAAEGTKQWFAGETQPHFEAERARLAQPGTNIGDVVGDPTLARGQGRWLRPRRWFHQGQVVWLAPSHGRLLDGMALSYLWRTAGQGSTGERLPDDGFHPCHDPDLLCLSCRVFGSADVRDVSGHEVDRRRAEQRSYRGHVRVLDAVLESGGTLAEPVVLPAMGSPRPGSGQFYLDDPQSSKERLGYQKPRNRWGTPDPLQPRHLRGRKFYWHTDPRTDERRQRWRAHDHAPAGEQVELVAAGSAYRLDVVFDGLTKAEIGGLVATLQPDRLFATQQQPLPYPLSGDPEYAIHIGGGKPLGLGSCQVRDLQIIADSVESRYLGAEQPVLDPADLIAAFVTDQGDLGSTWQNLAAALHTDHVDSRIVSYPTATEWADDDGTCSGKRQHEAFTWFQQTTGEALRDGERPFVPLPSVSDIAPVLPVHAKENR
ncbi:MAG: hypothetical protein JO281_18920 [Pseudonocardiales bacterium]|nr:hypothetical protein [Pseudonocardiales bacterium]